MKDHKILITGGSSGIGFEMAKQLSKAGNHVVICGRSEEKLKKAKEKVPELYTIQCDITQQADRKKLLDEVMNEHSDLKMLINNAGIVNRFVINKQEKLENVLSEELQTNYVAPVVLAQMFSEILSGNKGTVVNVSSGLAYIPLFIQPNYCATKAALHSITQSMRIQFKKIGVNVTEIFFPAVNTPFQKGYAPKNAIEPDVAAEIAIKGLESGKEEVHVKTAGLLYKLSRIMPKKALKKISGFVPENYEEILEKC
jgi:uncharacterized oxidoreductase